MKRIVALLALTLAGAACTKQAACLPGTVLVTLRFEGAALQAETVRVDSRFGTGPSKGGDVTHKPGDETLLVQIDLSTYTPGTILLVEATTTVGAATFKGSIPVTLSAGCSKALDPLRLAGKGTTDGGAGDGGSTQDATSDLACGTSTHVCGGKCADNGDPASCGARCSPCALPTDGERTTCDGETCGFVCRTGFHRCGLTCANDMLAGTCGSSCEPCVAPTGGTATCDGTTCGGKCPSGEKLCSGTCIPEGDQCSFICAMGTHNCNDLCAANDSINSCGPSACTACQTPTNGTVSCTGTACKATCQNGYKDCPDATCVPKGGCCVAVDCTPPPNAIATCTASHVCTISCTTGYHLCGGQCVSNATPDHCGTSCTPCPTPTGATATCDGQSCGATCGDGSFLCANACIPTSQPCMEKCAPGTHECGGQCLDNASTNSCGAGCTPCPVPANGQSTCELAGGVGTCGFTCATGYTKCGTQCIPKTSCCVAADCPTVVNGTATCSANHICGFSCGMGYHACSGMCASNMLAASCGTSCTACAAPSGGAAVCNGTACGFSCPMGKKVCANACIPEGQACMGVCPSGTHNCNGLCLSDTSVNSCGASCTACPAKEGGTPTCSLGACGFQCDPGFKRCGDACIPSSLCCDDGECPGAKCSSGKCCPASQVNCGGACVDLASDANNCGACGTPCGGRCSKSICCGANQNACGGVCRNTNSDPANCGAACAKCALGLLCLNGKCAL